MFPLNSTNPDVYLDLYGLNAKEHQAAAARRRLLRTARPGTGLSSIQLRTCIGAWLIRIGERIQNTRQAPQKHITPNTGLYAAK